MQLGLRSGRNVDAFNLYPAYSADSTPMQAPQPASWTGESSPALLEEPRVRNVNVVSDALASQPASTATQSTASTSAMIRTETTPSTLNRVAENAPGAGSPLEPIQELELKKGIS